ncbi:hypothetical protein [Rufibacter immobilis]|uniref:hypothetical protein n=1 Tax=Rufibacter immobilis TaxID=1348778 RepID=UPI0035EAE419
MKIINPIFLIVALSALTTVSSCKNEDKPSAKSSIPIQEKVIPQTLASKTDSIRTFIWETDYCEHQGTYNSNVYSEQQLKDTHYLWYEFSSINVLEDVTLDYPNDLTLENINQKSFKLDSDYHGAKNKLNNLHLIPDKFWTRIKELKTKELDELYALSKRTIEAYKTPAILLNNSYSALCQEYVDALASEDSVALFKAWEKLIEEKKKKNGAPELLADKFKEQRQSPKRLLFAKLELMTYGWWNCANHQRKYNSLYQEMPMEQEFNKLLIRMKSECDDVD